MYTDMLMKIMRTWLTNCEWSLWELC